jgi:hypothetical protein
MLGIKHALTLALVAAIAAAAATTAGAAPTTRAAAFGASAAAGYFYPEDLPDSWNRTASYYRGKIGTQWVFSCPAWPAHDTLDVWGSDIYTDDSSVCTAGVHAGLIDYELGGTVILEVRAGAASYEGTVRNGVATRDYDEFDGSFAVIKGSRGVGYYKGAPVGAGLGGWTEDAKHLRGVKGKRFAYWCSAPFKASTVWGTDVYTDDSSVCDAAVHSGKIPKTGGVAVIEMRPGRSSYGASKRNGIDSKAYGPWKGSFVVLGTLS